MNISAYIKMDSESLSKEIEKQRKNIKRAQETIRLLEKLQLAESVKTQKANDANNNFPDKPNWDIGR